MASTTLAIAGDIMVRHPIQSALTNGLDGYRSAAEVLHRCEVAVGNVEQAITNRGYPSDKAARLRGAPEVALEIRRFGFDIAFLANNHVMDYGHDGLLDTMAALTEVDIQTCGSGTTLEEAMQPAIWTASSGIRLAFLSLASTLPPGSSATPSRPGVAPVRIRQSFMLDAVLAEEQPGTSPYVWTEAVAEDTERAQHAISAARQQADVVIVGMHWGVPHGWVSPFQPLLADYQRPLGHKLVDAGADLIVGTHAHAVQGVEIYHRGVILYSLGNFLFHHFERPSGAERRPEPPYNRGPMQGPAFSQSVVAACTVGSGVPDVVLHPIELNDDGEPIICQPQAGKEILDRIAAHTRELDPHVDIDGDGRVYRRN